MKNMPQYSVEIKDVNNEFSFKTKISQLEKSVLYELPNPNYHKIQNDYQHLRYITLNDYDTKSEFPINMILDIVITQRLKHQREQELDYPGNRSQN